MSNNPNTKMIGLFTLVALIIFFTIIGMFVKDKFFSANRYVAVMYFKESVRGLYVGSPVVLKGVEVGKVSKINLIINLDEMIFDTEVFVAFEKDVEKNIETNDKLLGNFDDYVKDIVEKGLRAQLVTQNYLTGNLMIEMVMTDDAYDEKKERRHDYPEVPTILSPIGELSKNLESLPIKQTFDNLNHLVSEMNEKLPNIMKNTQQITKNLQESTAGDSGRGDLLDNMNQTLREVGDAARSVKNFVDYLDMHPEALLKGKRKN
ncbi:MAG: MlaD family protein [Alphaproteobacteria bacterium]|nr:MlaD family protein [Alphaproteobacteria bacterium]